jgi:uncharacterized protein YqeY
MAIACLKEPQPAVRRFDWDAPARRVRGPSGAAAVESSRRSLSEAQVEQIVRAEVAERRAAARAYEQAGQPGRAERLRAEADVLGSHLGGAESAAR